VVAVCTDSNGAGERLHDQRLVGRVVLDHQDARPADVESHDRFWRTAGTSPFIRRGSTAWNTLPAPGVLRTPTAPPWASTMRFVSASPRPVPGVLLRRPASSCWNSTNSPPQVLGLDAGARVVHLDAEELRLLQAERGRSPVRRRGVNLSALERLIVEHLLQPGRVEHHASDGRLHRDLDADLLSAAVVFKIAPTSPMACVRSIDSGRKSSFPDSTFARSRTSLIRRSRWWLLVRTLPRNLVADR